MTADARQLHERRARLFDSLATEPWAHDFYAVLRQIESLSPALPRLGRALRPSAEPLRLGQEPELDFAPAALMSFKADPGGNKPPRLGTRSGARSRSRLPLFHLELETGVFADPLDVFHEFTVAAGQDRRASAGHSVSEGLGVESRAEMGSRDAIGRRLCGRPVTSAHLEFFEDLFFASGQAENRAQEIVGPSLAKKGIVQIVGARPAHRRHVLEVESRDLPCVEFAQECVVSKLCHRSVGMDEGVARCHGVACFSVVSGLLHHPDERRKARACAHHDHVLETCCAVIEGEISHDPVDITEGIADAGTGKQGLGESTELVPAEFLECDVKIEFARGLRLVGRGGDRVGVSDGPELGCSVFRDRRLEMDVAVVVLDLRSQTAMVTGQRDVLACLVVRKRGPGLRPQGKRRKPRPDVRPTADRTDSFLCHVRILVSCLKNPRYMRASVGPRGDEARGTARIWRVRRPSEAAPDALSAHGVGRPTATAAPQSRELTDKPCLCFTYALPAAVARVMAETARAVGLDVRSLLGQKEAGR